MLLVKPPSKEALRALIFGIIRSKFSREEVLSWYQAVFKKIEWQLPLSWEDGYWYFYSLAYINERVRDEYFLRSSDMREYLLDMDRKAGFLLGEEIYHLRTFQSEPHLLRWPLAEVEFEVKIFEKLPTTRGAFERPLSMVEHVHLSFDNDNYLLVRQWEGLDSLYLLGTNREKQKAADLLQRLGFYAYIFP